MNKLQTLKCIEVTSQAQADNGTLCYHDPIANCDYLSYENGYVRRAYTRSYVTPKGYKYKNRSIYQLNPTKLTILEPIDKDIINDLSPSVNPPQHSVVEEG